MGRDDGQPPGVAAPDSTGPAVAGYPNFSMPVGIRSSGRPAGMLMYAGFLDEPQLLAMAYDLEQALRARQEPQCLVRSFPFRMRGFAVSRINRRAGHTCLTDASSSNRVPAVFDSRTRADGYSARVTVVQCCGVPKSH